MAVPANVAGDQARGEQVVRPGWLSRAIVSGFTASVVLVFTYMVAYGMAYMLSGVQLQDRRGASTLAGWFHNLIYNPVVDLARNNLYTALAIYLAGGLLWAIIYAYFVEPRLSGPAWLQGVEFSIIPLLFSLFVFLPIVGGGVLGLGLNAGPLPVIGNILLHVVYGATLGLVYGPYGDTLQVADGDTYEAGAERAALSASEREAARWLVGGIVVGAILGIVGAIFTQLDGGLAAGNSIAFVVSTALIGGACGALIGSFAGLPTSTTN